MLAAASVLPTAAAAPGAHYFVPHCDASLHISSMVLICVICGMVLFRYRENFKNGLINCISLFTCVWGAFVCCVRALVLHTFLGVFFRFGLLCCASLSSFPFDYCSAFSKRIQKKVPGQFSMMLRPRKNGLTKYIGFIYCKAVRRFPKWNDTAVPILQKSHNCLRGASDLICNSAICVLKVGASNFLFTSMQLYFLLEQNTYNDLSPQCIYIEDVLCISPTRKIVGWYGGYQLLT
jgi:hypothetical protein